MTGGAEPGAAGRERLLEAWYLASPLFLVADAAWGVGVRAAFLPTTGLRAIYYLLAFGCGLLLRARPRLAPALGMAESALNILLLTVAVLLPYQQALDAVLADRPIPPAALSPPILSYALSGAVLLFSFYRAQARLGLASPRRSGAAR